MKIAQGSQCGFLIAVKEETEIIGFVFQFPQWLL